MLFMIIIKFERHVMDGVSCHIVGALLDYCKMPWFERSSTAHAAIDMSNVSLITNAVHILKLIYFNNVRI